MATSVGEREVTQGRQVRYAWELPKGDESSRDGSCQMATSVEEREVAQKRQVR